MANYAYHRILPMNAKDSYVEFDVVDFQLDFPNRSLVLGTVRLEGEVEVLVDNSLTLNRASATSTGQNANVMDIKMDGDAGAHAFCETITTTINGQVVESIGDYPRYCKMSATAMTSPNDNNNSSK